MITLHKKAYAKINLYLKILDKLPDGYHSLFTIMQRISLCDNITISVSCGTTRDITIICSDENIANTSNTAYKAADLFLQYVNLQYNISVNINIEKHIPSQAGLGGGSSDAAAVLLALNEHFDNILSEDMLMLIAVQIGADVPFFVKNISCAVCEGIGEIITPFTFTPFMCKPCKILIIKPAFNISTKQAFDDFDNFDDFDKKLSKSKNYFNKTELLMNFNVKNIYNDFSKLAFSQNKILEKIRETMLNYGAAAAELSGSGSALFGIFDNANVLSNFEDIKNFEICGVYDFV